MQVHACPLTAGARTVPVMNHARPLLAALSGLALLLTGISATSAPPPTVPANGVSALPAMGWSSWSHLRRWPTESRVKAQADALVSSGLASHGYVYVNLDDFWQQCDENGFVVDSRGRWAVDRDKFPSGIKALVGYIHSLGLKFGFYVTPGIAADAVIRDTPIEGTSYRAADIADTSRAEQNYNCGNMYAIDYGRPGAQQFVNSWARQFASWGVDHLKIDGVGGSDIQDVRAWAAALRATGRPITYALSNNLPIADAATWRGLANSRRTQLDIECYCGSRPLRQRLPTDQLVLRRLPFRLRGGLAAVRRVRQLERPGLARTRQRLPDRPHPRPAALDVHAVGDGRLPAPAGHGSHRPHRGRPGHAHQRPADRRRPGRRRRRAHRRQRHQAGLAQARGERRLHRGPVQHRHLHAAPPSASPGPSSASPAPTPRSPTCGRAATRAPSPARTASPCARARPGCSGSGRSGRPRASAPRPSPIPTCPPRRAGSSPRTR